MQRVCVYLAGTGTSATLLYYGTRGLRETRVFGVTPPKLPLPKSASLLSVVHMLVIIGTNLLFDVRTYSGTVQ
jgi:hypothetical protein